MTSNNTDISRKFIIPIIIDKRSVYISFVMGHKPFFAYHETFWWFLKET